MVAEYLPYLTSKLLTFNHNRDWTTLRKEILETSLAGEHTKSSRCYGPTVACVLPQASSTSDWMAGFKVSPRCFPSAYVHESAQIYWTLLRLMILQWYRDATAECCCPLEGFCSMLATHECMESKAASNFGKGYERKPGKFILCTVASPCRRISGAFSCLSLQMFGSEHATSMESTLTKVCHIMALSGDAWNSALQAEKETHVRPSP